MLRGVVGVLVICESPIGSHKSTKHRWHNDGASSSISSRCTVAVLSCVIAWLLHFCYTAGSDSPSSSSSRSSGRSRNGSSGSDRSAAPQTVQIVGAGLTPMPKTIAVVIDNYRSVNDGEGLNGSDHSPVFATFILRLRHNFEKILQDSVNHKSTGSIGTVLNALSQGNQSVFNFGKDGNKAPKTVEFPMNDDMSLNTPPRSKSSRHNNPSTEPTKKRSGLSHALSAAPVVTEVPSTPSQSVPRSLKYSLLPPGIYRIRISGLKLIWGMNEETPASVSLLFPSPFEVSIEHSCRSCQLAFDKSATLIFALTPTIIFCTYLT